MKKFLLFLGVSLVSLNAYAVEHVIGISGGYSYSSSNLQHQITSNYKDENDKEKTKTFFNKNNSNNNAFTLNLEYQLRFNFLTVGLGYNNSNGVINTGYHSIKLNNHINDINAFFLIPFFQTKQFVVRGGASVGYGKFSIDSHDENNLIYNAQHKYDGVTSNLLVDGEYNMSNHFKLFSRITYLLEGGKTSYYKTNLTFDEAINHTNNTITDNKVQHILDDQSVTISFGIRYKI